MSPISSVLTRFKIFSRTLFSWPESTCTTNHCSLPASICPIKSVYSSEKLHNVHENEIEQRDVTAKQKHRDNDYNGRITQFLVPAEPLLFRVPRPRTFLQLY